MYLCLKWCRCRWSCAHGAWQNLRSKEFGAFEKASTKSFRLLGISGRTHNFDLLADFVVTRLFVFRLLDNPKAIHGNKTSLRCCSLELDYHVRSSMILAGFVRGIASPAPSCPNDRPHRNRRGWYFLLKKLNLVVLFHQ